MRKEKSKSLPQHIYLLSYRYNISSSVYPETNIYLLKKKKKKKEREKYLSLSISQDPAAYYLLDKR